MTRSLASRDETVTHLVFTEEYHCDGCGREISRDDWEDGFAHELKLSLDEDECVSFFRQRDYCPACLLPVWEAICRLLKSDPSREREEGRE